MIKVLLSAAALAVGLAVAPALADTTPAPVKPMMHHHHHWSHHHHGHHHHWRHRHHWHHHHHHMMKKMEPKKP